MLINRTLHYPGHADLSVENPPDWREVWGADRMGILVAGFILIAISVFLLRLLATGDGLWFIFLAFAVLTCQGPRTFIRRARAIAVLSRGPDRCLSCAYILRGLCDGECCPECGLTPRRLSPPRPLFRAWPHGLLLAVSVGMFAYVAVPDVWGILSRMW
jgi:hypothetical protein